MFVCVCVCAHAQFLRAESSYHLQLKRSCILSPLRPTPISRDTPQSISLPDFDVQTLAYSLHACFLPQTCWNVGRFLLYCEIRWSSGSVEGWKPNCVRAAFVCLGGEETVPPNRSCIGGQQWPTQSQPRHS